MTVPSDQTIDEVALVFMKAKALDYRFPNPDPLAIAAWAEQVEDWRLNLDDLMAGLKRHYQAPGAQTLGVGDLITCARLARKDRTERESLFEQDARQTSFEAKAIPGIEALAEAMSVDTALKYGRSNCNPLDVRCPHRPCNAPPGRPCRGVDGVELRRAPRGAHPSRLDAAKAAKGVAQ